MLKKLISITLTFIMIAYMAIPAYADDSGSWVRYSVNDGSLVTINWGSYKQIKELVIKRSCNGGVYEDFKNFKNDVPNYGDFSFTETGVGTYSYEVEIFGDKVEQLASSKQNYTVIGTGKPKIRLEFKDSYTQAERDSSVERIKNWVDIYNLGSTDLDLRKMKIKYFYTIDGQPSIVNSTKNPNDGQLKRAESDARFNPIRYFAVNTSENRDILEDNIGRMNFYKMPWNVYNEANEIVADYYCETYFVSSSIYSAYYFKFEPAFNKIGLNSEETDHTKNTFIQKYKLLNDYSYNNSDNIAVYYEDELIWGNDPSVLQAPKNLNARITNFKDVRLTWEASRYANGYNVWRREGAGGEFIQINEQPVTGTSFVDYTTRVAENSIKYYYKVTATYTDENDVKICESKDSNIVSVDMPILDVPSLSADYNPNTNNVTLAWTLANGAKGYEIWRSEAANTGFINISTDDMVNNATIKTFIDSNIPSYMEGKSYYYKVVAKFDGESRDSNIASVNIPILTAPSLSANYNINTNNVTLAWTLSSGAKGYEIWRSEAANSGFIKISLDEMVNDATINTFIDSNILSYMYGKSYYYKVVAKSEGRSKDSNIASVNIPTLTAPELSASYNSKDNNVKLEWDRCEGAQSYEIYRSEASNGTGFNSIGTVNVGDLALKYEFIDGPIDTKMAMKKYYYKVVAKYINVDIDSNVADVLIDTEYLSFSYSVISTKSRNDFALGTYIPILLKITVKRDVTNFNIVLNRNLTNSNTSLTNKLNAELVSEREGSTTRLFKIERNKLPFNNNNVSIYSSNNTDINDSINIKGSFSENDVINIQLALKTSANQAVLSEGIQNYYGKTYKLNFVLQDNGGNLLGSNTHSDSVIITKPNLK